MKNIFLLIKGADIRAYSSLQLLCKDAGLVYSTVSKKKYPIETSAGTIRKLKLIKSTNAAVQAVQFDPVLAKKIAADNGLKPSTIKMWKSRGQIPKKYFQKE